MGANATTILQASDPVLAKIIATIPEPDTESTNDVFFDLLSCILEQQIHYRSTKKTFQKMLDAEALDTLTPDNFHQLEAKALVSVKLSMGKMETIARIIDFWDENKINWNLLSDDEVIKILSSIKGIGMWTIDMILLYTLQRPNVFPYDDFHLKQIMVGLYGLDPNTKLKAQMIAVADEWGDHKSLAVRYLLSWKDFQKKLSSFKK
jgi:DNA-3-methyladenine glycosylase II